MAAINKDIVVKQARENPVRFDSVSRRDFVDQKLVNENTRAIQAHGVGDTRVEVLDIYALVHMEATYKENVSSISVLGRLYVEYFVERKLCEQYGVTMDAPVPKANEAPAHIGYTTAWLDYYAREKRMMDEMIAARQKKSAVATTSVNEVVKSNRVEKTAVGGESSRSRGLSSSRWAPPDSESVSVTTEVAIVSKGPDDSDVIESLARLEIEPSSCGVVDEAPSVEAPVDEAASVEAPSVEVQSRNRFFDLDSSPLSLIEIWRKWFPERDYPIALVPGMAPGGPFEFPFPQERDWEVCFQKDKPYMTKFMSTCVEIDVKEHGDGKKICLSLGPLEDTTSFVVQESFAQAWCAFALWHGELVQGHDVSIVRVLKRQFRCRLAERYSIMTQDIFGN